MKNLKKVLVGLLACLTVGCATVGLTACGGADENQTDRKGSLKFSLTESGMYEVIGIDDYKGTELVIPSSYDNTTVYSIGKEAFLACTSLKSVKIPDSVTSIGDSAFNGCSSLTSVTIGNGVTSIGDSAFNGCSSLTRLTVGNSVTSIGDSAFSGCSSLTSITIPNSMTSIGNGAFEECDGLTSVHITDLSSWCGIEFGDKSSNPISYAHYLYLNGQWITELVIPDGVTSIRDFAFNDCTLLKSVKIPDSVTSIGDKAFDNCRNLKSVTIGNGVTSIGNSAFYYCDSLKSVAIGNSVTSIGDSAFSDCWNLDGVEIPNGVTSIGDMAFCGCRSLTSVTIPDSVTSIGNGAFGSCNSLTIYCEKTSCPSGWSKSWNFCPVVWDCTKNDVADDGYIYAVMDNIRYGIKDGATVARQAGNIQTANIPTSITYKNNEYSVTNIGESAFRDCKSLTSVTIGNSVTNIGDYAFVDCWDLTSVTIGNSVTSIGSRAFGDCTRLTSIEVEKENTAYQSIDGNLYSKDGKTLIQYAIGKTATSFTIPNSVTSIGYYAFKGCSGLTSIEIPNSVTSIGYRVFFGCDKLTRITFNGTVEEWNAIYYKEDGWNDGVPATKVVCSGGEVEL